MKRSNRLLILIGIVLAVFAFVGVVMIANSGGGLGVAATPGPTAEPKVDVVVAAVDIHVGDKITKEMVTIKQYSKSDAGRLGEDIYTNVNQVIGKSAGGEIGKDAVIHADTDFLSPGTMNAGQSISGSLSPGMLGIAMEVDQISGVGNLLVPGDHVDVILSMWMDQVKLTAKSGAFSVEMQGGQRVTSKLIIQDRKIVGTLLPLPEAAAASAKPTSGGQTVTNNGAHMIVILEVTPQEAEVIRYAQREEKQGDQTYLTLGLALRATDDTSRHQETTGINFSRLVQTYYVLPPDPRGILPADIARSIQW